MQIEKIPITSLHPYEGNAKIHTPEQIDQIVESIKEFGFNDPVAVDENNMIIEGHGRVLALQELGATEVEVIRLEGLTEEQKHAYIHVHNQLTMNTGFDMEVLETELKNITSIDMGKFGFDLDFDIELNPEDFDDDEMQEEPPAPPRVNSGDIWQLGRHRIMCGDSTDPNDVDRLVDHKVMDLCVTDPPYNVNYTGGTKDALTIENDDMDDSNFYDFLWDFYKQMLRVLKPGGSFYVFHADSEGYNFRAALRAAGGDIKQTLIWVKNSLVLGRQDYQWKHEPCLYGWKDGGSHYFTDDRCQTTVFEDRPDLDSMDRPELLQTAKLLQAALDQANTSIIHEDRPARSEMHPTMKPVPLFQRLIQNSSRRGGNVIDLFGGSGTTIIACENCGRNAYVMELDPRYCDSAIQRWEDETGEKAVKISGK